MSTINKPKHPQKGENKEQNGSTHIQEKPRKEHQVPKPPPLQEAYRIGKGDDLLKGCLP